MSRQSSCRNGPLPIVIPCYNRPRSLHQLLSSLGHAFYNEGDTPLIFCIDRSKTSDVRAIAEAYKWPYGPKRLIVHKHTLGLRNNVLFCGDLSEEYGAVMVLEDDLIVSPACYHFATTAADFYYDDDTIAGISLYSYEHAEIASERFYPYHDGSDTYFMQWPSSWGQLWTHQQWRSFRQWHDRNRNESLSGYNIPDTVKAWPESSWKKYAVAYLADTGRYFAYPRYSLTTNSGDSGTHINTSTTPSVQVPLMSGLPETWRLLRCQDSIARYDSFFQPETALLNAICPWLRDYDYQIDLQGTKPFTSFTKPYLLSVRECKKPIKSFDWTLFPLELNLAYNMPGNYLHFGPTAEFNANIPLRTYGPLLTWSKRLVSPTDYPKIILGKLLNRMYRNPFTTKRHNEMDISS